ncbi:3-deoxy-D-manno-octulosonic acid kinase [Modicisalibacter zincidurans]|uniref:3-deoxy-D-manno-octulosonic acid kinase n=1 Tax=Modicisalibacter zincidurans TaxID=1178777 RepID=A0ABP9RGF8_9GAMM|nr:3-deoxy-D-manno-octulosonic acid kinase [Halomonas zincidurans]
MRLATLQVGRQFILHDAGILCDATTPPQTLVTGGARDSFDPAWFSATFWQRHDAVVGQAPGRGASLFVDAARIALADEQWVLRDYRRGGMAARLSEARYVWTGLERSRAFCEMRLTARLYDQGLPVPRPVAARVTRHGLSYAAALLTVRLAGARALAECLEGNDPALLERVGATIRRFHAAGLDHVDLNARNLLITPDERVWLIDLDRCRLRRPGDWQNANLERLQRSLAKFDAEEAVPAILRGYDRAGPARV